MNKNKRQSQKRADYIKQTVNRSKNTSKAIKTLSEKLFLSERTIERDLKK